MSALTYLQRNEPGLGRAMALAFAVHLVLIGAMFVGVRWQSHPADTVSVELWDPPPPPPAPKMEPPKPPPPPKVEPKPEPPKPEPEPELKKPDIAEKAPPPKPKPKPEPKPEPKPKPKPEPKPPPPKDDAFQKKMAQEELAREQQRLEEQRRRMEAERQRLAEAQRKAEAERIARDLAARARDRALGQYVDAITRKVRQNWILPPDLQGNPECVFEVVQLPTGEVISARLLKSSGNPAYDTAVERAILKSSPLPLPEPRSLFARQLKLTFRPRD